ncbi:MAG: hypothetical protein ABI304_11620, partial [Rudaea sp.]
MRTHLPQLAVMLAAAGMFVAPAHAASTDSLVDTTFGNAGWQRSFVFSGGSTDEHIVAAARTPDGGYLLAGSRPGGAAGVSIFLAKLRQDGSYDSAFGNSAATGNAGLGRVLKDAYLSSVTDMAIDAQGRIIVVGSTPGALGQSDFGVVRFTSNGADDTSFAGDGGTGVAFDTDAAHSRVSDVPSSVTTLPDSSIIIVGKIDERISDNATNVVGIAKLKPDGSLDTNFNSGSALAQYCRAQCTDVVSVARVVYDAPRNRLVIGGDYNAGLNNTDWFLITRDVASGTPSTYVYPIDFGGASGYQLAYMTNVAVQPDGKILASGLAVVETLAVRPVVLRRQASSVFEDTTFGNVSGRGIYRGLINDIVYNDVAVDSRGRIILVGTSGSPSRGTVERLTPNGILDAPFSSGYVSFYDAPF